MPHQSHRAPAATVAAATVVFFSSLAASAGGVDGKEAPPRGSPSWVPSALLALPEAAVPPPAPAPRLERTAQVEDAEVDTSDRPLVASVQKALRALGFDPGPVDGIIGPRTRSAVRAYQEARGLPEDGAITKALLASLAREITDARPARP